MKLYLAAITSSFLSASLALPTTTTNTRSGQALNPINTTFKIKSINLTTAPSNTTIINSLSFHILATNGGTLDFECKQFDPLLGKYTTEGFQSDYVYRCADNDFFSWSFISETGALHLWQQVSDDVFLGGRVVVEAERKDLEWRVDMRNLLV